MGGASAGIVDLIIYKWSIKYRMRNYQWQPAGRLQLRLPPHPAAQRVSMNTSFDLPAGYGKVRAYAARPAQTSGPLPVVLVVHENRGLNPHIEDIARRLALDNFIALAPDALFTLGGYPGDEDKARDLFGKLDQAKTREDFVASATYARGIAGGNGKLGAVGFCFGGGVVNMLATRVPELVAWRACRSMATRCRPTRWARSSASC